MVFTNKYTSLLIQKLPDFFSSKTFKESIGLFCDETDPITIHVVCNALTDYYINDLLKKNSSVTSDEIELFEFIEKIRKKFHNFKIGTDEGDFDNAICTCFLENLINHASYEDSVVKYSRFIPLLGEFSRKYCKYWDHFTGVRSPGLWEDAEWEATKNDPNASFL